MDDKGLDLSLGLPCGGSSSTSKDRNDDPNSADAPTDDTTDERTSKILNDFKNFLNAGIPQSSQENFFTNFSQTSTDKRKNMFGDTNSGKKQETESHFSDLQGKTSHLSVATDEGSTADNEEVAESESEPVVRNMNVLEVSRNQSREERANTFASDYPAIKPGIAADVKFGGSGSGSGSFPNLPWVSTTGPGPNGRTISGVTYKVNATQVKIVCACHGTHLSPGEFIHHACEEEPTSPRVGSVRSSSPAASAKS